MPAGHIMVNAMVGIRREERKVREIPRICVEAVSLVDKRGVIRRFLPSSRENGLAPVAIRRSFVEREHADEIIPVRYAVEHP